SGLVVCWACSSAWGCKSPAQPDGGEGLVKTQGLSPRGGVRKKRRANMRVDEQKPDMRRQCRTSGQLTAKSVSIKGAKRRSGGCAWKAVELTPGDLSCVRYRTEAVERQSDRRAEVSRGRI